MIKLLKNIVHFLWVCILAVSLATPTAACMFMNDQRLEDLEYANVVFRGELESYDVVGFGERRPLDHYGLLSFKVFETLKGEERSYWEMYWWNSTFGVPDQWDRERELFVAGHWANQPGAPLREGSATIFGTRRPELLQVLQAPCSTPFFIEANEESSKAIRGILDGMPPTDTK